MGGCGSRAQIDLMKVFGEEIGKEVAIEKAKEVVEVETQKMANIVNDKTKQLKEKTNKILGSKEREAENQIETVIQSIRDQDPEALKKAEVMHRKPARDFLGVGEVNKRFAKLRASVDENYSKKQEELLKKIQSEKQAHLATLNNKRTSLPSYDNLAQDERRKVDKAAEEKYRLEIRLLKEKAKKQVENNLNIDDMLKSFEEVDLTPEIQKIMADTEANLETARDMVNKKSTFC